MFPTISFPVLLVAALVSNVPAAPQQRSSTTIGQKRISPCPHLFRYDSVDQPGQWSGNVQLLSENDLNGVWLRVIFDSAIESINVEGFDVVISDDHLQALIKNRDTLLKAGIPTNVKITVKYGGSKFPNLAGYRLNAQTVCPNPDEGEAFVGDNNSDDFLSSIISQTKPINRFPNFQCSIPLKTGDVYPWQASISVRGEEGYQYICGATLISPSHVLTAAHCVTYKNSANDVPASSFSVKVQNKEVGVSEVIVHPGYQANNLYNNIAILKLNSVLKGDNITPVCIIDEKTVKSGTIAGYNIEIDGKLGNAFVKVQAKEISEDECLSKIPKLQNLLGDNTFCLSYSPDNTNCAGDSGSSYISLEDNTPTLSGIVSVGVPLQNKNECSSNDAVVVTDVSKYFKWILRAIQ